MKGVNIITSPHITLRMIIKDKYYNENDKNYSFEFNGKSTTSGNKTVQYVFLTETILEVIKKINFDYLESITLEYLIKPKIAKQIVK